MVTPQDPIPAVAYLRRSTDRQEQSLGDQRMEIARFAQENGYHLVGEYVDDAISGTNAESRQGFQRMIADATKGGFRAVIVWNSDRFSRGDVTETEHYRYLLRRAGVALVSVTEGYLNREGIDADVLRTVKQFQNRQFSISLSQNTLRGQLSSIMAKSDPGRAAPYGYDREMLAPDGALLFRIRFCTGGVREVYDKDGKLQARYARGQALSKPGKECKARLVLSSADRVDVIKDIYRMCLDGTGFGTIASELNARGIAGPNRGPWSFTTIKSILSNPTYRGDLVWNRRTEAKFYRVQNGRAQQRQMQRGESQVAMTPQDQWVVLPNIIPPIISKSDWQKAQLMMTKRREAVGAAGQKDRRWLLTGVLVCGDCGHRFWAEPRHKGHKPGRSPVVTNYYVCAGRRRHGPTICQTPSNLHCEPLETWTLDKLREVIELEESAIGAAIDQFIATTGKHVTHAGDELRIQKELKQVADTVAALTMNIDPENLAMLNDRLTQLRTRKQRLEQELEIAKQTEANPDAQAMRKWAREKIAGLQTAMAGVRNDITRNALAAFVDKIKVWPSQKRGELVLNASAYNLLQKRSDRPEGRSRSNLIESPFPSLNKYRKNFWFGSLSLLCNAILLKNLWPIGSPELLISGYSMLIHQVAMMARINRVDVIPARQEVFLPQGPAVIRHQFTSGNGRSVRGTARFYAGGLEQHVPAKSPQGPCIR